MNPATHPGWPAYKTWLRADFNRYNQPAVDGFLAGYNAREAELARAAKSVEHREECPDRCSLCEPFRPTFHCHGCSQDVELGDSEYCDYDGTKVSLTTQPDTIKEAK